MQSLSQKLKLAKRATAGCLNPAPELSLWFYNYLSQWEETEQKKLFFKKKAGDLAFESLKNYEQALVAYSTLKDKTASLEEKSFYTFRMAFSYFERGKWEATLQTLKPLMEKGKNLSLLAFQNIHKPALFLKARALLLQEEYQKAKLTFQEIRFLYPLYFREQEMFLYLSFIYEEQKDFHNALAELEDFPNTSGFLRDKIKNLKIRQANQAKAEQGQTL